LAQWTNRPACKKPVPVIHEVLLMIQSNLE